jgi:hypothetical protein
MESRPLSIKQILQQKPDATVGDVPYIQPEIQPTINKEEISRMCTDIDTQIQQLEAGYEKILGRMATLYPRHPDIASTIDDLDPSKTIQKLQAVKKELERIS